MITRVGGIFAAVASRLFFTAFLFTGSTPIFAQNASSQGPAVVNQFIEWFPVTSTMKLTKRIQLYSELQFRYVQDFQPMQYQVRVVGEYLISKKFSIAPLGYVYSSNPRYGKQPAQYVNNEHRIFQQGVFKHKHGKFEFHHRLRVEERFIQAHSINASDEVEDLGFTNFQVRLRYRASVAFPLNATEIKPGTLSVNLYDEIFISRGAKVTYERPDQNRLFAGLGYHFSKSFSMQSGFFYQIIIKADGLHQENNIGILTQLNYNFDFTRVEN